MRVCVFVLGQTMAHTTAQQQLDAITVGLAMFVFAFVFVFLPVISGIDVLTLDAAACIVPGVVAVAWPQWMLFVIRARPWRSHDCDLSMEFLQAWGLFSVALGVVCACGSDPNTFFPVRTAISS